MDTAADAHPRRRVRMARCVAAALALVLSAGPAGASATTSTHADASGAVRVAASNGAQTAPGFPWAWPVTGPRAVVEPFRAPAHDYGPGHRGMDIAAQPDAVVRSPAAGVIAFRGMVVDRPLITIDHGAGYVTTLEPVTSTLAPGDAVAAGESVGAVALGGHSPRGALHVGVRIDGRYVNPHGLFGAVPRAILLPCCAD